MNSYNRKNSQIENLQVTKSTYNQSDNLDVKKNELKFSNFMKSVIFKQVENKQNLNEIQMNNNLKPTHISHKCIDGDDESNEKDVLIFDKIENNDCNANKNRNSDLLDIDNLVLSSR